MQKQNNVKKRSVGEGLFCLLMVLFAIFEVILLTVILVRCVDTTPSQDQPQSEETTPGEEITTQPPVSVPVFSGGVVPTYFRESLETQLIGDKIYSNCAALIDVDSGTVIAAKNATTTFDPASMAKVMALIVLCENLSEDDMNKKIVLTQELTEYVMTGIYENSDSSLIVINQETGQNYYAGDYFVVKDLLYGVGVASAADCTIMLATAVCPSTSIAESEQNFVALMNQKAKELGLKDTSFDNAVGLEGDKTKTTALDMAIIMTYAMQSDLIADILSVKEKNIHPYYIEDGEYCLYYKDGKPITFYLKSTLFNSRMNSYKNQYQSDFTLQTAVLEAGKTGRLTEDENPKKTKNSTLVCWLLSKNTDKRYVLVVGVSNQLYYTMSDIKTISDIYIN